MNPETFHRLEDKVDVIADALGRLILFEERQFVQSQALISLGKRTEITEKKLEMWINRAAGGWAVLGVLGTVLVALIGFAIKVHV